MLQRKDGQWFSIGQSDGKIAGDIPVNHFYDRMIDRAIRSGVLRDYHIRRDADGRIEIGRPVKHAVVDIVE